MAKLTLIKIIHGVIIRVKKKKGGCLVKLSSKFLFYFGKKYIGKKIDSENSV